MKNEARRFLCPRKLDYYEEEKRIGFKR